MQIERYIMSNVRFKRTFRVYVQNIMRHAKAAKFFFSYNQMFIVWNNLNLKFRMQIFESIVNITLKFFFDLLNSKVIIWMKITFKRFNNVNYINNMSMINKNCQVTNKQNREWQNRFFQQFVNYDFSFQQYFYTSWSQDYIFYQFRNFVYQKYQQQYR